MDIEVTKDPTAISGYPQERILHLYPDEMSGIDIVGDEGYFKKVIEQFGKRCMRGTALGLADEDTPNIISKSMEPFLRQIFSQLKPERAVEIGTLYGVTTALLAHYSRAVITIDLYYQQTASYLWGHFGVQPKIRAVVVKNDRDKKELCKEIFKEIGFDFAFIDAMHTYDAVKFDFDCVKDCGRVLFHDYGLRNHPGITEFVDELPSKEVWVKRPFAYWEKNSQ